MNHSQHCALILRQHLLKFRPAGDIQVINRFVQHQVVTAVQLQQSQHQLRPLPVA